MREEHELNQNKAPIYEALQKFRQMRVVPFDVPGHKRGRGNPELTEFLGERCISIDVNSMKPLDNLCHPISVIREAEELAADAFGAAHAFLMVGGTTSSVQTMVLSVCKRGDKIILPRNVHRSVINALVLCGAIPVYVNPEVNHHLGISLGMKREQVAKAIAEHPDAVAVLVNNPTYYGICSDLKAIVKMAHDAGMYCLADEAHGTHFYFGEDMPVSAMEAGADMASVSMHKSGGSLTQSSLLLVGPNIQEGHVRKIINLTQTTSGSYLLMSSLDISRRNLALRGRKVFRQVSSMAAYAREEINAVGGYYAFGSELINGDSVFDFDPTKLSVHTRDIGLAGIEVYDLLRDEYDIQIEFGDIGNILAYLSIGDRPQELERLVSALAEIRRRYQTDSSGLMNQEYIDPEVVMSPQEAFYAETISVPIGSSAGCICSEFVMCYPPGIPILAPGEKITEDILNKETAGLKEWLTEVSEESDIDSDVVTARSLLSRLENAETLSIFTRPLEQEQTEATITFYVAECMEFPVMGEYHENLTLEEALHIYETIPAERMNGIKGVGFELHDGSDYDGPYDLMRLGKVDREGVEMIQHYKESPLVQKAMDDVEKYFAQKQELTKSTEQTVGDKSVQKENDSQPKSRKESVLQALRERQVKIKEQEQNAAKEKSRTHKKGEVSL